MLSNAYFLAKFRFDTAENEPAKNLQNFKFSKNAFFENAFCKPDHRKADPRVARGGLDDGGAPRRDLAAVLGALDHRERDPVLDGAARVLHLQLEEDLRRL